MHPRSVTKILILVSVLIVSAGCAAGRYGRTVIDDRVKQLFESYMVMPGYRYYYSGPDAWPYAVIAIRSEFTLRTDLWKPVDPTSRQLKGWFNWAYPRVGYDPGHYGRYILSDDGRRIGLWYSVRDWRDHTVVRMVDDQTVEITPPIYNFPGGHVKPLHLGSSNSH